jgi:hypothetical protein
MRLTEALDWFDEVRAAIASPSQRLPRYVDIQLGTETAARYAEALRVVRESIEWQPVETAPKDERILLWYPKWDGLEGVVVVGCWHRDEFGRPPQPHWTNDSSLDWEYTYHHQPTHWRRIPEAPR